MRRVLLLIPVLLAVVAATFVVTHDWSDDRPVADVGLTAGALPFPGSTTPLPVPEIAINDPAWRDQVEPFVVPTAPPARIEGCVLQIPRFKGKSTGKISRLQPCKPQPQ